MNEKIDDQSRSSARIDEVAKYLFEISDPIIVDFLNGAFHLKLNKKHTAVISCKNEYPDTDFSLIKADIVLKIIERSTKTEIFHLEVQLHKDNQIEMRLFEYGYRIAGLTAQKDDGAYELTFPRQIVIFIEENRTIGDSLTFRIITPDRQRVQYQIPVIRVWEYDIHSMIRDRLFILLPFKIFRFRKILTSLSRTGGLTPEKKRSISDELMAEMQILVHEINTLAEQGMIDDNANFILISATTELINYLNRNFLPECRNEKKVEQMFVSVTEKAMQKGIQQGIQKGFQQGVQQGVQQGIQQGIQQGTLQKSIEIAKKLLKKGVAIEEISELTGVDIETITELNQ